MTLSPDQWNAWQETMVEFAIAAPEMHQHVLAVMKEHGDDENADLTEIFRTVAAEDIERYDISEENVEKIVIGVVSSYVKETDNDDSESNYNE